MVINCCPKRKLRTNGAFLLSLFVLLLFSSCGISTRGSGTGKPVLTRIIDQRGEPLQGVAVTFEVFDQDTLLEVFEITTDADGEAAFEITTDSSASLRVRFVLNRTELETRQTLGNDFREARLSIVVDDANGAIVQTEVFLDGNPSTQTPSSLPAAPEEEVSEPARTPTATPTEVQQQTPTEAPTPVSNVESAPIPPSPTQTAPVATSTPIPLAPSPAPTPSMTPTAAPAADSGLIAYWNFEGGDLPAVLDSTANQNNGIASGGVGLINSRFGKSIRFDGIDGVVDIPHFNLVGSSLTIMFWVRPLEQLVNEGRILSKANSIRNIGHDVMFAIDEGVLAVRLGTATRLYRRLSQAPLPENSWTHVSLVGSSEEVRIYINAVLVFTASRITGPIEFRADRPFSLGNQPSSVDRPQDRRPFQGDMDEIRIYNRQLTEEQINREYEQLLGP